MSGTGTVVSRLVSPTTQGRWYEKRRERLSLELSFTPLKGNE